MASGIGLGYLVGLTGVVAFGAVIPVVPTGAAVSVGAAIGDRDPIIFALVVAFGAAGAYAGDLATYAILRVAGQPLAQRVGWLHEGATADTLAALRTRIEEHELPVLLAAALGGYSWRRFAIADIAAASLWSAFYAAIGLAGRAVFPEPWQAAVAAIVLVLAVTAGTSWWKHRRDARATSSRQLAEGRPDLTGAGPGGDQQA